MTKPIEELISELEARVTKLEAAISAKEPQQNIATQKKLSPKEFLLTKNIQFDRDKTLALAYFLERMGGMSSFNISDLANAYQSAKEQRPKNLSDTVSKNVARATLMYAPEKDGKKAWTLTTTGEKYVEEELNK